jgi:hypothetical protein
MHPLSVSAQCPAHHLISLLVVLGCLALAVCRLASFPSVWLGTSLLPLGDG